MFHIGIILLDPQFQSNEVSLNQFRSKYREFSEHPLPQCPLRPADPRGTYATSLIRSFELKSQPQSALEILHEIIKIVVSEWIVVNAYLERDLNRIEWLLEQSTPDLATLEFFLRRLFIMRRRIRKYESIVSDHLEINLGANSQNVFSSPHMRDPTATAIKNDLTQVQELIRRNASRIKETVGLITSVMSVLEGKKTNTQNQGLIFLTLVATVTLPFNAFVAIFSMNTEYTPGQPRWPFVRKHGLIAVALTVSCYFLILLVFWARNKTDTWMLK